MKLVIGANLQASPSAGHSQTENTAVREMIVPDTL